MKKIMIAVLLAASPAVAQEFAADMPRMGEVLAQARIVKIKHAGRPRPPLVLDYEARHIGFRLIKNGSGRDEGGVYVNKAIEILYMDSYLATLEFNDDPRGWPAAERLLKAFESLRRDAVDQKRRLVIDYDAIHRQNEAGAWLDPRNPRECELFDEAIRLGRLPST
jgi:hypothetical protein